MTSTLNTISPVLSEVEVEVPVEDVTKAIDTQYATLRRTAKIRGFRKGKVPVAVLKRMFGEAVLGEVRQDLIATHLEMAIAEHELRPLSQPSIEAEDVKEDAVYTFKAKFENRPKLEELITDGIEIEKTIITIKDEEIQAELDRLRDSRADVTDLDEPRPAAEGDLVKIKTKRWLDGEWKDTPWPEQEVVPGQTRIEKEVEEAIIGANVGDEKVVDLGSETELEEERSRYLVTINSIQDRKLPDVDDEFAKDLGDYETLDDLKKSIAEQIEKKGEQMEERRLRDVLFDALREKNPMELPPTLVEQQATAFRMRVQASLGMMNKDDGPGEDEEQAMFERSEKAAKEMVHQHLLALEVARIGELDVGEDAIDEALQEIAEDAGFPLPMVKAEYAKEGRREELGHQLLEKKIFDFLAPKVKITEVESKSEDAEDKE